MNFLKRVFDHTFTGKDGKTYDIARFSWAYSLGSLSAIVLHEAWTSRPVDLVAFGTAVSAIVVAHGAAIWGKKDTEPGPPNESSPAKP